MPEKPFQSSEVTPQPPKELPDSMQAGRPVGVTLLAIVNLFNSVSIAVEFSYLWEKIAANEVLAEETGISPELLLANTGALAVFSLASGIGLWRGAKWGWWITCFFYVYSVVRKTYAIGEFFGMATLLDAESPGGFGSVIILGVQIALLSALMFYLMRPHVLAYFGLHSLNKGKALGVLTAIAIALIVTIAAFANVAR